MANPKILIVDDEPFNVDYLEQELEELDCDIITATNGQDALDKVQSELPDLVLLDIMMPVMDGFTVLARMKSNSATREIPVIVISANNNLPSVVKGIQLGAEDYLPKPFESVLLHARITSSLEKKHLRDIQQLYLKSLENEFEIARNIQASFLPAELPQLKGWEIAAYFKAAREVAGDFYDVFKISEDNFVCVIGDVCGKGVGAALFMTLFRSLIRSAFFSNYFSKGEGWKTLASGDLLQQVVEFVNHYVSEVHSDASMFATVFVGIFNRQNGTLTYANCGNEPPLVAANGSILDTLSPTGPVIGLIPDACFSVKEIVFEKEQFLIAFTDGVSDALNEENVAFGKERLYDSVIEGQTEPSAILTRIETQLSNFVGTASQFDDISVLVVKRSS